MRFMQSNHDTWNMVEARELGDSLEIMESSPLGVDRWIEDTGASLLET